MAKKGKRRLGKIFGYGFIVFGTVLLFWSQPVAEEQTAFDDSFCTDSDPSPAVVIGNCDTGVANHTDAAGCSISQRITACALQARNHGEFVSCVARITNSFKKAGMLADDEKGRIQRCAAAADIRNKQIPQETFQFAFESGTDALSVALQNIYNAYTTASQDSEEILLLQQLRLEGIAYLQAHPEEASDRLIQEASNLDPVDQEHFHDIFYLLSLFESQSGLDYLFEQAGQPLPARMNTEEEARDLRDVVFSLRRSAIDRLGVRKLAGSQLAGERLFALLANPDLHVKKQAIRSVYATSDSRWKAKQEMRKLLPFYQHFLLHEIY